LLATNKVTMHPLWMGKVPTPIILKTPKTSF
jgi:hypothetical protein